MWDTSAYALEYAKRGEPPVNAFYQALSQMAWVIVFEDKRILPKDSDLAEALAERANTMSHGTRPGMFNMLARIAFIRKDLEKAVALQSKAVELAKTDEDRAAYSKTLEECRQEKR